MRLLRAALASLILLVLPVGATFQPSGFQFSEGTEVMVFDRSGMTLLGYGRISGGVLRLEFTGLDADAAEEFMIVLANPTGTVVTVPGRVGDDGRIMVQRPEGEPQALGSLLALSSVELYPIPQPVITDEPGGDGQEESAAQERPTGAAEQAGAPADEQPGASSTGASAGGEVAGGGEPEKGENSAAAEPGPPAAADAAEPGPPVDADATQPGPPTDAATGADSPADSTPGGVGEASTEPPASAPGASGPPGDTPGDAPINTSPDAANGPPVDTPVTTSGGDSDAAEQATGEAGTLCPEDQQGTAKAAEEDAPATQRQNGPPVRSQSAPAGQTHAGGRGADGGPPGQARSDRPAPTTPPVNQGDGC